MAIGLIGSGKHGEHEGSAYLTGKFDLDDGLALQFDQLADRFDLITPDRYAGPGLLAVQLEHYAVQAGRLLGAAYRSGRLSNEDWVQKCIPEWLDAPIEPRPNSGMHVDSDHGTSFNSDEDRFSVIWTFAVGSWACKYYAERMRHKAGELDWAHYHVRPGVKATVTEVRNEDGRVIRTSARLPDGALVCEEDLYNEKQAIARLCARIAVYADACRLLAWCMHRDAKSKLTDGKGISPIINSAAIQIANAQAVMSIGNGLTVEKLKLLIRQQVKAEGKTNLSDDVFVAAYRQQGSVRKAADFLSKEIGRTVSKDQVQRAVKRSGGIQAACVGQNSESIQRTVASQRRDRSQKFASPTQPPEVE